MKRYCFALDVKDDDFLIKEYKAYHNEVWPEILESIKVCGIENMEIYITGNRLFMIMETKDTFSLEEKAEQDKSNFKVQDWENLMWKYQQALPNAKEGEKWVLMERMFKL